MFWKRNKTNESLKLPSPKDIPELVGRHMVVEEKKDPDWVWSLKGVVRPTTNKKAFYCRVFSKAQAEQANVMVEDWTSLDSHPELIIWEGYFDKEKMNARREKFIEPSSSSG